MESNNTAANESLIAALKINIEGKEKLIYKQAETIVKLETEIRMLKWELKRLKEGGQ